MNSTSISRASLDCSRLSIWMRIHPNAWNAVLIRWNWPNNPVKSENQVIYFTSNSRGISSISVVSFSLGYMNRPLSTNQPPCYQLAEKQIRAEQLREVERHSVVARQRLREVRARQVQERVRERFHIFVISSILVGRLQIKVSLSYRGKSYKKIWKCPRTKSLAILKLTSTSMMPMVRSCRTFV